MTLSTDATQPTTEDSSTSATQSPDQVPPIRREVIVNAAVETAFSMFTAHIDRWWPIERHSVFGAGALVAFEDGVIVERLGDQSSVWAEVTAWDPPARDRDDLASGSRRGASHGPRDLVRRAG